MRLLLPEPGRSLDDRADLEAVYSTPATASLRANFIVSLDAAVEIGGRSGGLGGPADTDLFATLRALTDVVVVGASTAKAENYGPAKVAPEARERRRLRGQTPLPTIAVVSGSADLEPDSHLFSGESRDGITPPRPLILTSEAAPAGNRRRLADVGEVVICGDQAIDLATALRALRSRGLAQVLCEGGPTLLTSLVTAALVDELCLTHAPVLAGPGRQTLLAPPKQEGGEWDEVIRWTLLSLAEGDGLLFARYGFRSADPVSP